MGNGIKNSGKEGKFEKREFYINAASSNTGIFEMDAKIIYGVLYIPESEKKCPAVIMCHGYNGCNEDFDEEGRYFAKNGYVACAFDFCGGSTRSKSSGKSEDMTIFTEKEDLLTVFDHIRGMDIVDESRIYLFGGSQGGLVTALAAAGRSGEVKAAAMYYPAFCIPEDWNANYATEEEIPPTVDFWNLTLGRNFFVSVRNFDVFEHIGKFTGEVLIIHGDKDEIVPIEYSVRAREAYKNARLVILHGEGHGYTPEGRRKAMETVLEFMQSHSREQ